MADNGRSPIHIKKQLPELGIEVNCFGNNAAEVITLLSSALDSLNDPVADKATAMPKQQSQAQRELGNAENHAKAKQSQDQRPQCPQCGSCQTMDLITFTDQKSGNPMARYKCQACKIWAGKAFATN